MILKKHFIRNVILLTAAIATPVICAAADADQSWTPEQIGWQCFPLKPDKTLAYKTVTGKDGAPIELKLQVFLPQGWQASDQRPAAVFFHGGGWHGGGPDHYYPQSRYLALRGMVAISVEYRTINRFGTSPKECVKDGKSAMRWVKAHAAELGIDPEQIVAGGGSAGGHIAAATALVRAFDEQDEDTSVSCIPKALLLFNPVFDNGPDGFAHELVQPYWKEISPIDHIDAQAPPAMVLLGTEDIYVPVETAKRFERQMKENGRRCDLHLYEGQKHGWYNLWVSRHAMAEALIRIDRFLTSLGYLDGEPVLELQEQDTLRPLGKGETPESFDELWQGYDPRKEPLDVEIIKEWEEDGVVMKLVRYRVAIFNGKKAMLAAIYGYPKGAQNLPGLIHIHGGGQYAHFHQVLANAKRGYATISLAWDGRLIAPGHTVNNDHVKAFKTGNTSDPNYKLTTDWVGVDAGEPSDATIDPVKSPRNTLWFYAGMGCRRALTFLERQKEVDGNRLGVYGHSMGGKLTVITAGSDKRVKAAAPSCGGVSDIGKTKNIPGYATTIDDNVYLQRITCPIVFQSPTNDFHAAVDDLTLAANLVNSEEWRITSAAHINHNDLEENTVLQPLWFDQFLKGTFQTAKTPQADLILKTESGIPRFDVKPDQPDKVMELNVYYTEEGIPGGRKKYGDFPTRNWKVAPAKRHGDTWVAEIPTFSADKHLWVYANAKYPLAKTVSGAGYGCDLYTANEYVLSSLMSMLTPQQKKANGVNATQQHSLVIEDFEGDWEKRWFYTRGGHPDYWSFKTFKAMSPMHMPPANAKLVVEARSAEDNKLVISTFSSWDGGQEQRTLSQTIKGGNQWQTISLLLSDLRDKQNKPLASWSEMKKLQLSGLRPRPEFRNLCWEE